MLKLENIIYQTGILGKDLYNVKLKLKQSDIKGKTYRLTERILLIAILTFFASWFVKLTNVKKVSNKILQAPNTVYMRQEGEVGGG